MEKQLEHRAFHDPLTDLHNRTSFYEHLGRARSRARRQGGKVALLLVDLDDFKAIRPGDIVFFKEAGRRRGITHVGLYSGRGNLVHASAYFGKVVESKMRYVKGYSGAQRLRPR